MTIHEQVQNGSAEPATDRMLSIGALSQITGISVETLRTWERRYGYPTPARRKSGHRRYPMETVARLRLVRQALDKGMRPSKALPASESDLWLWLGGSHEPRKAGGREPAVGADGFVSRLLEAVRTYDADSFERTLRQAWQAFGARDFVQSVAVPLLHKLGTRWGEEEGAIADEHFATDLMRGFLTSQRVTLSEAARGPVVICATPSGERHELGLQLASVLLVLSGLRVVYLGADVPALEIAAAARTSSASGVVLGTADGSNPERLQSVVDDLRAKLPDSVPIVVGGATAPPDETNVTYLQTFKQIEVWAEVRRGVPTPAE